MWNDPSEGGRGYILNPTHKRRRFFRVAAPSTMIVLLYLILGMFLDGLGMMLLTLPFVFPIIQALGFNPIWFGIIMTIMIEIGLLTPPVGLNCYILAQIAPHITLAEIFRGVVPFVILTLLCVLAFTIWPEIVMILPQTMFGK
jgi:TRAP-type C4-dicarboxylate transport system permease large subunit